MVFEVSDFSELGDRLDELTVSYDTPTFLTDKHFYITYDLTKRHFGNITDDISGTILRDFYERTLNSTYSYKGTDISGGWVGGNLWEYKAPYKDPENYAFEIFQNEQVNIKYLGNDLSANHTWRLTYCSDSEDIDTAYSTILYGSHADGVLTVDPSGQFPASGFTTSIVKNSAGLQYIYHLIDAGITGIPDPVKDPSWTTFLEALAADPAPNPAQQYALTEFEVDRLNAYDLGGQVVVEALEVGNALAAAYNMTNTINTKDGTIARGVSYTNERFSQTIDSDDTDDWDVTITGGSVGGDPYITTFSGITYKMDDFTGYARMLQGTLDNRLFTINAETNLLTKEELTDLIIMRNEMKLKMGNGNELPSHLQNDKFPAYFTKLYVQWGNDIMVIDLKEHKIISDTRNENYEIETCDTKEYSWSNKHSKTNKMLIPFGDVTLVVKKFANLDLRNGFTVLNHSKINNRTGALENTLYTKDIKLKKLNTLTPLKRVENRQPKRMSKETFNESETFSRIVELPVF